MVYYYFSSLILYFDQEVIGFETSFLRARFTSFHTHASSVSLSYFILAVSMCECLGKHSCMSCSFLIAILKGTCVFWEAK